MSRILPKAMEDRAAIGHQSAHSSFLTADWRGSNAPAPKRVASTPVFGRAQQLHLRAAPASYQQECERARSIADAGCEAISDALCAITKGTPPPIADLVDVVAAITASLLRDAIAFRSVMRLRQQHAHTYMHSVSVCQLMIALATEMQFDKPTTRDIGLAGLLHDIGKSNLPQHLLENQAWLKPAEAALLRTHPEVGCSMLSTIPMLPAVVLEVCRSHHERPDGAGYPDGLLGSNISIYARMCAVCNFYDKMTSPAGGVTRWSPGQTIDYLRSQRGEFDPPIVAQFVRTIGTFLPGVLVRLRSDRIGVILDGAGESVMHPDVVVFSNMDKRDLVWQLISTKADPILSIERPENWSFGDWEALRDQLLAFSR